MPPSSDHDLIAALARQGVSARVIADRLGVTMRTVYRVKARAGLAAVPAPRLTEVELDTVERLLAEGASISEAARTIGRCQANLNRHPQFAGRGHTPAQAQERRRLLALERQAFAS